MSDSDPTSPFNLPAETLAQAVTKAEAILKYWKSVGGYKAKWDELDACYSVACHPGGVKWGHGLNWRQLVAMVKGNPVPTS